MSLSIVPALKMPILPWAQFLEYSSHRTDLVILLLRYGSDPLIPQLGIDSKTFDPDILKFAKTKETKL